jgi:hypothetical protein
MSIMMLVNIVIASSLYLFTLNHVDPVVSIPAVCKLCYCIVLFTAMMYRWCLTITCCDRFALSSPNVRLRNFSRVQMARCVIIINIIVWIILPVHVLICYNIRNDTFSIFYNLDASLYHSIFITVIASILPILIMTICALLIHRNLTLKRQCRQCNASQGKNVEKLQSKRDKQVLIMLFIQMILLFYL